MGGGSIYNLHPPRRTPPATRTKLRVPGHGACRWHVGPRMREPAVAQEERFGRLLEPVKQRAGPSLASRSDGALASHRTHQVGPETRLFFSSSSSSDNFF
jgi:hypothetical protein